MVELITILLFASLIVILVSGLPLSFGIGAVGVIFAYFLWGPEKLGFIVSSTSAIATNYSLLAIPLFVFMANMLERSGVADDLYNMMHQWFGPVRGGLGIGTVLICTIMAAMSGISAAAVVTMGVIALPAMLKRNYDRKMTIGCIAAGGALGQLIPPSAIMILYAFWANESVGRMFLGGVIPGLILSALFIIYIGVRCFFQPHFGPPLPPEERVGWAEKLRSLRAVIFPALLIVAVLGSMFAGLSTATESAAVGSFGSILCAILNRRFNWNNLKSASYSTLLLVCMILWIMISVSCFTNVFITAGGSKFVTKSILELGLNRWIILWGMQFVWFVLGCLIDPTGILMITVPVFVPIIKELGFNSLWFGVLFVVNMEMSFLTPPFGFNLFYLRNLLPDTPMEVIYSSVWPFIILQAIGLAIVIIFPQSILWLPNLVLGE